MRLCRSWLLASSFLWTVGCTDETPAAVEAPPPPVNAVTLEPQSVIPRSFATAELLANRHANLSSETAGRVVAVLVAPGERVESGQVLLRLDVGRPRSAVQAANAAVEQSDARLKQARRELARTEKLVETGGPPEQPLDEMRDSVQLAIAARDAARAEAQLAKRGLTEAVIRAPFAGTVVDRAVELGEYLGPGSPLLSLADTSVLKARVLLDPREALDLSVGAPATVSAYARPGEDFAGEVIRVGEVIDPRTRRLPVEIELDDHSGRLRPGLVARFSVQTGEPQSLILVPLDGVFERFGSQYVYVVEDGIAHRRAVVLGAVHEGRAEVIRGVEPGDRIVSKGVTRVVDGSKVQVVAEDSATASTSEAAVPGAP